MQSYHDLLKHVLENGVASEDRTGTGTISVFGTQTRFNLEHGFPAVTTKKLSWKPVVGELLWFSRGSTNVEELREITWGKGSNKKTVWDDNYNKQAIDLGYSNGELGPVYGHQWRNFNGIDQLRIAFEKITQDSNSRRNIVSAWNPSDLDRMALPPCHTLFQFYVRNNKLSLQMYQRSGDLFLGGPFNIASYSLLLSIAARITGTTPHEFIWTIGDAHIYNNHIDQVKEQLSRTPLELPTLQISNHITTFDDFVNASVDDFKLLNYNSYSTIKAEMAV
jgi:thymidylate synthase